MKEQIKEIIEKNQGKNSQMYSWYKRFRTDEVPIYNRKLPTPQKINNKLNHDYVSMLVNTKVNHYLGTPVSITINNETEELTNLIKRFKRYTAFNRVISEVGKQAALYGYGCTLAYIDKKGEFDFISCKPYNCYFSEELAIREIETENRKEKKYEVYDKENRYIYSGENLDKLVLIEESRHMFDDIPLFKILNNEEEMNEFYRVIKIVDNIDKLYSDLSSEVEQFRLAYVKFTGIEPDADVISKMVQTGAITLPAGADAGFITKQIAITEILKLIEKWEQNLFKIAMSYDSTDTQGSGQLTNLGIFFKLAGINNNSKNTILYFIEGLYTLFGFYSQYLTMKGIKLDPLEMEFQFVLETPRNVLEEAEVQQKLNGLVSTESRLKLASFVENPTEEMLKLEKEQKGEMNLGLDYEFKEPIGE